MSEYPTKEFSEFDLVNPEVADFLMTARGKVELRDLVELFTEQIAPHVAAAETAQTAAEAAQAAAETAKANAETAEANAGNAAAASETAADFAVEVSRIAYETLDLNAGYQFTLAVNKCYLLDDDPYIQESIELTLPTFETAPTYLQQIEMQIVTGTTAPTISWGTAHFFRRKVPTIAASSYYSAIWEYDRNLGAWVCSVISKS